MANIWVKSENGDLIGAAGNTITHVQEAGKWVVKVNGHIVKGNLDTKALALEVIATIRTGLEGGGDIIIILEDI